MAVLYRGWWYTVGSTPHSPCHYCGRESEGYVLVDGQRYSAWPDICRACFDRFGEEFIALATLVGA